MRRTIASLAAAVSLFVVVGCASDGRSLGSANDNDRSIVKDTTPPTYDEEIVEGEDYFTDETLPGESDMIDGEDVGMMLTTPFGVDEPIPVKFTCDGQNVSPAITWDGLPEGTVEVAIQVIDLEAEDFTHWVIAGLKPEAGGIKEGEVPAGAIQATNSKGTIGYTGPCPPQGSLHNYLFEVDALDQRIDLPNGTDADTMLQAVGAATIGSASTSGNYTR
jgi:Raf kinase inhibitor-like YbhB/YbcL family protein